MIRFLLALLGTLPDLLAELMTVMRSSSAAKRQDEKNARNEQAIKDAQK